MPLVDRDKPRVDHDTPRVDLDVPCVDRGASRVDRDMPRVNRDASRVNRDTPRVDLDVPRVDRDTLRVDREASRVDLDASPCLGCRKTDLQAQLQAKSDLWTEKESAMQDQLAGYKNIVDKLRVRSAARVAGAPEPAEEDELSLQAEYSAALEAELESLQRDVKAKKSVDDKKTRLIEQLDARVGNLERRLTALLTLLETCCRGSDAKTAKLMTAAKTVEQLIAALDDSEHLRVKLKSANGELTTMLHAVEEKGMKIGQMAKLKLTKYAAENRRLKAALGEREGEEGEKGETKGEAEVRKE